MRVYFGKEAVAGVGVGKVYLLVLGEFREVSSWGVIFSFFLA